MYSAEKTLECVAPHSLEFGGGVEMLRRVVRKAVEASKSLPGAETRRSPLLTSLPRVFFHDHAVCNCNI